jgi:hypothetical protein
MVKTINILEINGNSGSFSVMKYDNNDDTSHSHYRYETEEESYMDHIGDPVTHIYSPPVWVPSIF